jgi:hypothetical protein
MSDATTQADASPSADEALAQANTGYAKARGIEPPAPASSTEQATVESGDEATAGLDVAPAETEKPASAEPTPTPAPTAAPAPAAPSVSEELTALKQKVKDMEANGASKEVTRRLHGEIGNLNRSLKNLQSAKDAPAEDELAAALQQAEDVAKEYPELGTPLVKALRLLSTRQVAQPAAEAPASEAAAPATAPAASGYTTEQQAAIKAIDEAHPDRTKIKDSPEFKTWLAQTPEYRDTFWTSWNPAVVSGCLTEFKAHRKAEDARAAAAAAAAEADRKRKQDRLAAGESPQGVPNKAAPTTLPDDAGFQRGYAKVKRLS